MTLKQGPKWGVLDPLLSSPYGLNHIDGRLNHQCNYGFWTPNWGPPFWGLGLYLGSGGWGFSPNPQIPGKAPTPNPRYPFGGIAGHSFLVTSDPTEWLTRIWGIALRAMPQYCYCICCILLVALGPGTDPTTTIPLRG